MDIIFYEYVFKIHLITLEFRNLVILVMMLIDCLLFYIYINVLCLVLSIESITSSQGLFKVGLFGLNGVWLLIDHLE